MIKIVYSNITITSSRVVTATNFNDDANLKANFQIILNLTFYCFLNLTIK